MRRNIYVRDEDEELFRQAEAFSGSLSRLITAALREYLSARMTPQHPVPKGASLSKRVTRLERILAQSTE